MKKLLCVLLFALACGFGFADVSKKQVYSIKSMPNDFAEFDWKFYSDKSFDFNIKVYADDEDPNGVDLYYSAEGYWKKKGNDMLAYFYAADSKAFSILSSNMNSMMDENPVLVWEDEDKKQVFVKVDVSKDIWIYKVRSEFAKGSN